MQYTWILRRAIDGQESEPLSTEQVHELCSSAQITQQDRLRRTDQPDWLSPGMWTEFSQYALPVGHTPPPPAPITALPLTYETNPSNEPGPLDWQSLSLFRMVCREFRWIQIFASGAMLIGIINALRSMNQLAATFSYQTHLGISKFEMLTINDLTGIIFGIIICISGWQMGRLKLWAGILLSVFSFMTIILQVARAITSSVDFYDRSFMFMIIPTLINTLFFVGCLLATLSIRKVTRRPGWCIELIQAIQP